MTAADPEEDEALDSGSAALDVLTVGLALGIVLATILMLVQGVMQPPPPPRRSILVMPPIGIDGEVIPFGVRVSSRGRWVYPSSPKLPKGVTISTRDLVVRQSVLVELDTALEDAEELEVYLAGSAPVAKGYSWQVIQLSGPAPVEREAEGFTTTLRWTGSPSGRRSGPVADSPDRREFDAAPVTRPRMVEVGGDTDLTGIRLSGKGGPKIFIHVDRVMSPRADRDVHIKLALGGTEPIDESDFDSEAVWIFLDIVDVQSLEQLLLLHDAPEINWRADAPYPDLYRMFLRGVVEKSEMRVRAGTGGVDAESFPKNVLVAAIDASGIAKLLLVAHPSQGASPSETEVGPVWIEPACRRYIAGVDRRMYPMRVDRLARLVDRSAPNVTIEAIGDNGVALRRDTATAFAPWPKSLAERWTLYRAPDSGLPHVDGFLSLGELPGLAFENVEHAMAVLACVSPEYLRDELGLLQSPAVRLEAIEGSEATGWLEGF